MTYIKSKQSHIDSFFSGLLSRPDDRQPDRLDVPVKLRADTFEPASDRVEFLHFDLIERQRRKVGQLALLDAVA